MKNKFILLSFLFLIFAIIFSTIKIGNITQKYDKNIDKIIRYGKDVEVGDIIYINGSKEKVVKVYEDGSYITNKIK